MVKIFVPQPIPEVAAAALDKLGEVTTFPHVDRQISETELLEAVVDKEILFGIGEVPFTERVINAAKELKFISVMIIHSLLNIQLQVWEQLKCV